jgi:methionine-rich copper-binding protein CopC
MHKPLLPLLAAALALMPTAALAHVKLVGSTPAANTATSKVTSVQLKFNEKIALSTVKTELVMTGMPGMANHPPMKIAATSAMGKDGRSMTLALKRALVPGTYSVKWSAAGADAHRVQGEFRFTVK